MTPDQVNHRDLIAIEFTNRMAKKYEAGALEHGGKLWEKEGLLEMAVDEAIDQVVYLLTLKQQLENPVYVANKLLKSANQA